MRERGGGGGAERDIRKERGEGQGRRAVGKESGVSTELHECTSNADTEPALSS